MDASQAKMLFRLYRKALDGLSLLYLFTRDDFISIVIPNVVCGVAVPLADGILQQPPVPHVSISRIPLVTSWVWANLLLFNMSNQSQPGAIKEDAVNKPWRPIVSGRISVEAVHQYLAIARLSVIWLSEVLGGAHPCIALQLPTLGYNDFNGGEHWIPRNLLNAGGYLCFIFGAMQVAVGREHLAFSDMGLGWLGIVFTIIASTMQVADMYDQEGDRLRNRKSVPLVFGDRSARYSIVFPVAIWSLLAPAYWTCRGIGFVPTTFIGSVIIARLLRNFESCPVSDRMTFVYWSAWIISIYPLPLWLQQTGLSGMTAQ